jgi:hypothetical protein
MGGPPTLVLDGELEIPHRKTVWKHNTELGLAPILWNYQSNGKRP